MFNKLSTSILTVLVILALSGVQFALAAPVKADINAMSDKALQLAFLDRTHKASKKTSSRVNQKRSVRIKRYISKRKVNVKLPSNCLKWSSHQINRQAKRFERSINDYARQYRVDKDLVKAVITVESCFRVKAKSNAGAQGLMQLIPATAKRFGVRKSYNPRQNIRGGVRYLQFLKARYKGDLKKILAAYNAGEGAVDKHKGVPPFKETKNYVKNVLKVYARLNPKARRVSADYSVAKKGQKPGRHGWEYNRTLAPHLYKN